VPARLETLDDDQIAARVHRALRLLDGAHLPAGERAPRVHELDEPRVGIAEEELDQPRAGRGELDVWLLTLAEGGDEVDAEGSRSSVLDLIDAFGQRSCAAALQHAEPAGAADRAHERRCRDPASHRGQLDRDAAADEFGERRREHR
jgi:hypothetical protein